MATIPASQFVQVIPGVLNAGGNSLVMQSIVLTQSFRVPMLAGGIPSVLSFASAANVGTYFGSTSNEAITAGGGTNQGLGYFGGFNNCTTLPPSILFAQFPSNGVGAWLIGGNISGLTIPQLQTLSGSLTVVIDGYTYTAASINFSGAVSFSAAATLIQTGLNTSLPAGGTSTGSTIAAVTSTFTGSIAGAVLTVTTAPTNTLVNGCLLTGGTVTAGTTIANQLTQVGAAGGIGTYAVSISQLVASASLTATYGTLTVAAFGGAWAVGQTVTGGTTLAGTIITALGTGTGGNGTYFVNKTQTVASAALASSGTAITCTFDSTSGGFLLRSGTIGNPVSTIAYATGTLSASIFFTQQTGAVISQGSYGQTPATFMANIVSQTQNWVAFMTIFDPDGGASNGSVQKQNFAAWTNTQLNRYAYIAWDTDTSPTLSNNATASFGNIVKVANYSGTCVLYQPTINDVAVDYNYAAFVCGSIASINFNTVNGRADFAFLGQTGLIATVTNQTVYQNLLANGYNVYCATATANQPFVFFQPGSVSGPFLWLDSYVNQIWMNAAFQLALMELLVNVLSLPYNAVGYSMIEQALVSTINQALNFGAIRTGVPLSSVQQIAVNTQAGLNISTILTNRGWASIVQPATLNTRLARQTPPCFFWYMDGQSIQQITLNSIIVQ
jgi:hypothetical protein